MRCERYHTNPTYFWAFGASKVFVYSLICFGVCCCIFVSRFLVGVCSSLIQKMHFPLGHVVGRVNEVTADVKKFVYDDPEKIL